MNLKGFIMEDDQGREFVMVCEQPSTQLGTIFSVRGWQRRRLVPLHHTERELCQIIEEVQIKLEDLFKTFPRSVQGTDKAYSAPTGSSAPLLRSSKASQLRKRT